jgi:hypothetical protein
MRHYSRTQERTLYLSFKTQWIIQWNSLKTSPVKKISRLRSQDKKAPKFSHLINITGYPFDTSPHKKISRLRSDKFTMKQFFYPFNTFPVSKSKEFPRDSFRSVSKTQRSNGARSRSLYHVSHSRMTQPHGHCGGVVFLPRCRDCSESLPLLGLLSQQRKNCIGWLEANPSCFVTCMSLHLATFCCFNSLGHGGS